ncbi:acyltransferase [Pedobacter sp. SYSU D00535]|uniref:acyltransferase family protein n=1 Tax=Pedobacter sp. SYSU D00535 TaxID=2810308 RepID=UPI001A973408|nr:acyltransferase [Pedobacter sp. SYSU D00535]
MKKEGNILTESSWAILAIVRMILASIVCIGHLEYFTILPKGFTGILLLGGKAAVLGFLLISGFSIGNSYVKSARGYFKRRFLRIYPLYFFSVLFAVFLQSYLGSPYRLPYTTMVSAGGLTSLVNFFFLQGFASITIPYNGPLWSLAVEVFFYLLVPLLLRFPRWLIYLIIVSSMISFNVVQKQFLFGHLAFIYCWAWLIGFLIGAYRKYGEASLFFVFGIAIVYTNRTITTEPLSWLTYFAVGIIIFYVSLSNIAISKATVKVFNYLGELSYPLYLFHMPLYLLLYHLGVRQAEIFCLLLIILTIPLNYVLDRKLRTAFWIPFTEFLADRGRIALQLLKNKKKVESESKDAFRASSPVANYRQLTK